jgi:cytochrome c oxidase subunit 2
MKRVDKVVKRGRRFDASVDWQRWMQDLATPIAEGIIRFHHDRMCVLIAVSVFVAWMRGRCVHHFDEGTRKVLSPVVHGTVIEVVWTRVPARILVRIAVLSFALLYSVDELVDLAMTVKVVGHQWYWSYEYTDERAGEEGRGFDSYRVPEDELQEGQLRLREVDNRMARPVETHIRRIVTAADVLHSWTVLSFGVKIDACLGRLNQVSRFVTRLGVYYGQCSEICGVNHGFMLIAVEAVQRDDFVRWLRGMQK